MQTSLTLCNEKVNPATPLTDEYTMTSRKGLANLGNTCYLNSAIQALRRTNVFAAYLGSDEWAMHRHKDRRGYDLATEVIALMKELQGGAGMIIPRRFVQAFIGFARDFNDEIQNGAQADAAEAIQILLDGLHTQHAREVNMEIKGVPANTVDEEIIQSLKSWASFFSKEYSPFVDEFYGQTRSQFICSDCNARRMIFEPWSVLKVEIPGADKAGSQAPNLRECIASAFCTETLEGYTCDHCKKKGTTRKEQSISKFPQTLILSLKRFTNAGSKVRARIAYDENCIDMSEWVSWAALGLPQQYRVVSTIEHLGSSRGGHYIMRAKESDAWYVYDDNRIAPCKEGGDAGPDTYILFLQKI
jgi:ubiquitin C-terminal hydrolase